MVSKKIPIGEYGSLVVSEEAGVAKLQVVLSAELGGGAAKGIVTGKSTTEVDVDAHHLIDLGLELLKSKFPSASVLVDGAKAIIDGQIAKV